MRHSRRRCKSYQKRCYASGHCMNKRKSKSLCAEIRRARSGARVKHTALPSPIAKEIQALPPSYQAKAKSFLQKYKSPLLGSGAAALGAGGLATAYYKATPEQKQKMSDLVSKYGGAQSKELLNRLKSGAYAGGSTVYGGFKSAGSKLGGFFGYPAPPSSPTSSAQ